MVGGPFWRGCSRAASSPSSAGKEGCAADQLKQRTGQMIEGANGDTLNARENGPKEA
jgi:hypothetical protein